jgi:DNA-binding transcriptional MerR regulator
VEREPFVIGPFSRRQIAELTGIDGSTLNYWMREDILRAESGGHGRGSHRRFAYPEVTLAAILNELRAFGIGTPSLAKIAERFHAAIDWMGERGISLASLARVEQLKCARADILREGKRRLFIHKSQLAKFANFEIHDVAGHHCIFLDWDQILAHWSDAIVYDVGLPTANEVALAESWISAEDIYAFDLNSVAFKSITSLGHDVSSRRRNSNSLAFFKDEAGEWQFTADVRRMANVVSYLSVDTGLLALRLWGDIVSSPKLALTEGATL